MTKGIFAVAQPTGHIDRRGIFKLAGGVGAGLVLGSYVARHACGSSRGNRSG